METLIECSEPGTILDEELRDLLAGQKVRPAVVEHISHCQYCTTKLVEYCRIENRLIGKLYRWDCPAGQILGEYLLGLLSSEGAAAVKKHLSTCAQCAVEAATLLEFLESGTELTEAQAKQTKKNHQNSSIAQDRDMKLEVDGVEERQQRVIPPYMLFHQEIEKAGAYQLLNPERARLLQAYLTTEQTFTDIQKAEGFKS